MKKYQKIFAVGLGLIGLFLFAGVTIAVSQVPAIAEENDMETNSIFQPLFDFAGQDPPDQKPFKGRVFFTVALAEALGIPVDDLKAARQEALKVTVEQAVEEGVLSEERAEVIKGRAALAASLDPEAILVQVLGITSDELQAARDEGKTLADLVEELGLDPATVRENMAATREQVIQQALEDGVITPEQAELLQNRPSFGFRGPGRGWIRGHRPFTGPSVNSGPASTHSGSNFPVSTDSL